MDTEDITYRKTCFVTGMMRTHTGNGCSVTGSMKCISVTGDLREWEF